MSQVSTTSAISGTQDQFLQLLLAQLQNQDPLSPTSDTEFISQLAQFNQLSGIQSLNASFSEMLKLQQLTQGTSLIGKQVQYSISGSTTPLSGTVDSVAVNDGKISLQIGNNSVSLDNVSTITA